MKKIHLLYRKLVLPEFNSICGKYYQNLIIVFFIFLIALLSIGFGQGVISYLDKKMNDPFIQFVNVLIPSSAEDLDWRYFNNKRIQNRYGSPGYEEEIFPEE